MNLILPCIILLHLFCSPYTKVEESFNIQATHDIIAYGFNPFANTSAHIEKYYDHVDFPGAVPRTFTGALLLAGLTQPFVAYLTSVEAQLLVRAVLGLLTAGSLLLVRSAVDTAYGKVAGRWYVLLQASQFHVMYYASRTLPNIYAFILTNTALSCLILTNATATKSAKSTRRRAVALYCMTVAGIVFRSELAILLAAETLQMLGRRRASLLQTVIPAGIAGAVIALSLTVPIDSMFWRRWTWPELEGFYYNTILGKSSDWGTSPFHYYIVNTLPRLLLNPVAYLVCLPAAFAVQATRQTSQDILTPHMAFILVYSLLPHKEWRFVMYSIPAFTAVAAGGAAWIWNRRAKSKLLHALSLLLIASTALTFLISTGILYISSLNYPGGEALRLLHRLESGSHKHVYLDNLACQTGVTRFTQMEPSWTYDKTEDKAHLSKAAFWRQFDYVIVEDHKSVIGNWQVKGSVASFDGVTLRPGESEDIIPMSVESPLYQVQLLYNRLANAIRSRVTRNHWPAIKTRTRLYILEREILSSNQDPKLTIQM
ncbi:hypothetical protein AMS68_001362 [Peltaster fructicola]|uniref:Mannosyltransferase n=1 Tax=Peltaster fructicola TaxID=286661 RepID=A0A6H0XMI7_9PEZI|nr:hypothetical protein AMS68_001362 [Peltaster fructicola]